VREFRALISRLLRDPLLRFLLVGLALFAGWRALHPDSGRDLSKRIVVSDDDLRQMSVAWLAQGRPAPTPAEMQSLVENWIREEILFREALELGLDQDDTIVKRRMVQKMEFLADDLSDLREPTRAELEAWYQTNAARVTRPPLVTFHQLYFAPDRRSAAARDDAERALAKLAGTPADAPEAAALADPFPLQDYEPERSPDEVAKQFGPGFARDLFAVVPGAWSGPIESGFGWHLVFVDAITPARVPGFSEVEPALKDAWLAEQRAAFAQSAFERMKARYEIVLPATLSPELAAGDAQ
jgi:hypothetical protein